MHDEELSEGFVEPSGASRRRRAVVLGGVVVLVVAAAVTVTVVQHARTSPSVTPAGAPASAATSAPSHWPSYPSMADADPEPHEVGTRTFSASDPGSIVDRRVYSLAIDPVPALPQQQWTVTAAQIMDEQPDVTTSEPPHVEEVDVAGDTAIVGLGTTADGAVVPVRAGVDLASGELRWVSKVPMNLCDATDASTVFCTDAAWPGSMVTLVQQVDPATGATLDPVTAHGAFGHDVVTVVPQHDGLIDVVVTSAGRPRWRTTIHDADLRSAFSDEIPTPSVVPGAPELLALPVPGICTNEEDYSYRDGQRGVRRSYLFDRQTGRLVGTLDGLPSSREDGLWSVRVADCAPMTAPSTYRVERLRPASGTAAGGEDSASGEAPTDDSATRDSVDEDLLSRSYALPSPDGSYPASPVRVHDDGRSTVVVYPPGGQPWNLPAGSQVRPASTGTVLVASRRSLQLRDAADGHVRWTVTGSRDRGVLAIDGERVLVGRLGGMSDEKVEGTVTAYDLATGAEAWRYRSQGTVTRAGARLFDVVDGQISLLGPDAGLTHATSSAPGAPPTTDAPALGTQTFSAADPGSISAPVHDPVAVGPLPQQPHRGRAVQTASLHVGARDLLGHDAVTVRVAPSGSLVVEARSGDRERWRTTLGTAGLGLARTVGTVVLVGGAPELLAVLQPGVCTADDGTRYPGGPRDVTVAYILDRETGSLVGTLGGRPDERVADAWRVQVPDCRADLGSAVRYRWERLVPPEATQSGTAHGVPDGALRAGQAPAVPVDAVPLTDPDGRLPVHPVRIRLREDGTTAVIPPTGARWVLRRGVWRVRVVADDAVLVTRARAVELHDLRDGTLRWRVRVPRGEDLLAVDGERVLTGEVRPGAVPGARHGVTAYDLATGAEAWHYGTKGSIVMKDRNLVEVVHGRAWRLTVGGRS